MVDPPTKKPGMLQSILLGYLILVLHLFLIILIAVSAVFLEGLHRYLGWVLGGGLLVLGGSGIWFWRRTHRDVSRAGEFLAHSVPGDRPVEIRLFGGVAQVRLGARKDGGNAPALPAATPQQLQSLEPSRVRQLEHLATLLDQEKITAAEFQRLKTELLCSTLPNHGV